VQKSGVILSASDYSDCYIRVEVLVDSINENTMHVSCKQYINKVDVVGHNYVVGIVVSQ